MNKTILLFGIALITLVSCHKVDFQVPPPVFDTGVDASLWAVIPTGEFLKGQFQETAAIDYDYEIMVTDVTNEQYAAFLNAIIGDGTAKLAPDAVKGYYPGDPFNNGRHEVEIPAGYYLFIPINDPFLRLEYDGTVFAAQDAWKYHPMTMVSWFGAKAYCKYFGWRLPTETEWEKAARGTDGRAFPWGNEIARSNANYTASRDPFEKMTTFGSRTTPVGFFNGSKYSEFQTLDSPSPYGLYDMAGNVWQWTADVYPMQHYRYMRGGSKDVYENSLRVWVRNSAIPTFTSPGVGFRCVR
jgi:formylglycine-generating enzyme